jgi:nucleoid-associated protein YgaU
MFGPGLDAEHPFDRMRDVSRTRVRRRRVVLIAMVALVGGVWAGPFAHAHDGSVRPVAAHRYVVREGDTMWDIASRLGRGDDPRALMDRIASANAVDPGALRPGQTLLIPSG